MSSLIWWIIGGLVVWVILAALVCLFLAGACRYAIIDGMVFDKLHNKFVIQENRDGGEEASAPSARTQG